MKLIIMGLLALVWGSAQAAECEGGVILTDVSGSTKAQLLRSGQVYDCQETWMGKQRLACSQAGTQSYSRIEIEIDESLENFKLLVNNVEQCSGSAATVNQVSLITYKTCMSLRGGLTPLPTTAAINEEYSCGAISGSKDWSICQSKNFSTQPPFVVHTEVLKVLLQEQIVPLQSNEFIQYCN